MFLSYKYSFYVPNFRLSFRGNNLLTMVMLVQQAHSINANQKKLSTIFFLKIFGIVINLALDELQNLRDKKVNIHYKWKKKKKKKPLSFLESF